MNFWLALAAPEHIHAMAARHCWASENGFMAFSRFTQIGFLRLMTTAAAMDRKPSSMAEAWKVHDRVFDDDRVAFPEPPGAEPYFREYANGGSVSPKVWADAWLLAFARAAEGRGPATGDRLSQMPRQSPRVPHWMRGSENCSSGIAFIIAHNASSVLF